MVAVVPRNSDSLGAPRFSRHLLLLSQSLLSRVLSGSAGVRRRRVACASLQRRNTLSLHSPKPASLLSLCRHRLLRDSLVRRDYLLLVSIADWKTLRRWRRIAGAARKHHSAFVLH